MSKKRNGVNWSKSPQARLRRAGAMKRLQNQLKTSGTGKIPALSEKQEKRIVKEIETLKERI